MQDVITQAKELIAAGQTEPALQLLQEHAGSELNPSSVRAKAWRLISVTCRNRLDLKHSSYALAQAAHQHREAGEEMLALECELKAANDDINSDRYVEAEHACTRILSLAEEQGWWQIIAQAHEVMGSLHRRRSELEQAVDSFMKAIKIYSELGLESRIDSLSMNLAKAYVRMGRSDLAKPYYERGTAYLQKSGDLNSSVLQRMGVANTAWLARDYGTAEQLYLELLDDIKDYDSGFITAIVRQGIGMLRLAQSDFKASKKHLLISLQNIEQGEHRRMRVANLTALAIISVMLDEPQEALSYATLSRDNCFEQDDIESQLLDYYLAIIYLANDNPELAMPLWAGKQAMAWTVEMDFEYEWMILMLDHIMAEDYVEVTPLPRQVLSMARDWREEVLALNDEGRDQR